MAVINVKRDWSKTEAPATLNGQTGRKVFTVLLDGTDSPDEAPYVARRATGIPSPREPWSNDEPNVRACAILPRPLSPVLYEVTVDYSQDTKAAHPLDEPMKVRWSNEITSEPIDTDIHGNPIVNTAGLPFEPPIQEQVYDTRLTIVRNEATFDGVRMAAYRNTVNSKPFRGAPPRTCRMVNIEAEEIIEAEWAYYRVTYEIVYRDSTLPANCKHIDAYGNEVSSGEYLGWRRRIANKGMVEKIGTDAEGLPIYGNAKDTEQEPLKEPIWLDVDGKKLADDADKIFILYETVREADWTPLYLE